MVTMLRAGFHHDHTTQQEHLVITIRLTRPLSIFHGACFIATHLAKTISAFLPTQPIDIRILFLDATEYRLRSWCEARPNPRLEPFHRIKP